MRMIKTVNGWNVLDDRELELLCITRDGYPGSVTLEITDKRLRINVYANPKESAFDILDSFMSIPLSDLENQENG